VPRSTIPLPFVHENAWEAVFPAVAPEPTTWPLGLSALAELKLPPSVPRSIIPPVFVHENAWLPASPARELHPTTCPLGLNAAATL
jgi:hypothetical protein